jgi:hypothetical protein
MFVEQRMALSPLLTSIADSGESGERISLFVFHAFWVGMILLVDAGRNWARLAFCTLTFLSIPVLLGLLAWDPVYQGRPMWSVGVDVVAVAIELVAAFLLLTRRAALWYQLVE